MESGLSTSKLVMTAMVPLLVRWSLSSTECLKCQRQWRTFPSSVTLTAEEGVLERAPTSVTHVTTSAIHTLWSVSMSVLQATPNVMITAMMQVYQSRNAILLSRAKRAQGSLQSINLLLVTRLDSPSAALTATVFQLSFTSSAAFAMLSATSLMTAVMMQNSLDAYLKTVLSFVPNVHSRLYCFISLSVKPTLSYIDFGVTAGVETHSVHTDHQPIDVSFPFGNSLESRVYVRFPHC